MVRDIGELVKQKRLLAGLTVRELADRANVSASYIYAFESGLRGAHIEKLARIAKVLQIEPALLMEAAERSEDYQFRVKA